jgi:urease accessory protein
MTKISRAARLLPLLLLAAPLAQAHPGHGPHGFVSGLVHPFTGWDHLLAMVAVGLWAAQLGGRARWAVPATFVSAMIAGAAAGIMGFVPPGIEIGILASVLVLGLLVASATRLPLGAGIVLVALAGACHGAAHGAEMPAAANSLHFLEGMVLATAILHATGVAAGLAAARRSPALVRWAGAAILGGGVALLLA